MCLIKISKKVYRSLYKLLSKVNGQIVRMREVSIKVHYLSIGWYKDKDRKCPY